MDRASISIKIPPPAPLRPWVEFLWYWEGTPATHRKESVIAGADCGLVVNLAEDRIRTYHGPGYAEERRLRGMAVSGPSTSHFAIDAFQPKVMGASLRPGGARAMVGLPICELRDAHLALEDLWGGEARFIHEQIVHARTPKARLRLFARALLAFVQPEQAASGPILHALACFRAGPADQRVAPVARELAMSRRRLVARFRDEIGIAPKLYLRLRRFERLREATWALGAGARVSWAELAHDYGYSDQPHLIREFREFSGLTPTQYRARRGAGQNHSAVLDEDRP